MYKLLPLSAAALAVPLVAGLALTSTAQASIPGVNTGDAIGTSEAEIVAALEALGATIDEVEVEENEIEVELTFDGVAYEVEVDITTGQIAEIEAEDDEDEEDDDDNDEENDDN